jgi:multiple sugar transport system ATP-binding protein
MGAITFENLTKTYAGSVTALHGFRLDIADGEFLVLVGPSGCGKSTVLRCLAGLEAPTSGTIKLDGQVINDLPPQKRDLAMVFQSYALYPHLTVFDNLAFGLRLRKQPAPVIRDRITAVAEKLKISRHLQKKPRELSGGERQRVALGRAMVRQPRAFLMDEPLSNLDAALRLQVRTELLRLQRELRATFVYVTHDQTEAMTMGHRVALLHRGCLQQVAPPVELYEHPANLFVAGFIGSPAMNFLPATLTQSAAAVILHLGPNLYPLPEPFLDRRPALAAHLQQPLIIGIRPEYFAAPAEPQPGALPFPVHIEIVETLGPVNYVHFRLPKQWNPSLVTPNGKQETADALLIAILSPRVQVRPGNDLVLSVDPYTCLFFDSATGQSL